LNTSEKPKDGLTDGVTAMRKLILICSIAFMITGCGDSKEDIAINAAKEFIMTKDNGTTKLTDVKFFPDGQNVNNTISGFVCGDASSPKKDGGMMTVPFYSHVLISGENKNVTDTHLAFSWDESAKIEHDNKCKD
jgi:hypothetical protein